MDEWTGSSYCRIWEGWLALGEVVGFGGWRDLEGWRALEGWQAFEGWRALEGWQALEGKPDT